MNADDLYIRRTPLAARKPLALLLLRCVALTHSTPFYNKFRSSLVEFVRDSLEGYAAPLLILDAHASGHGSNLIVTINLVSR